jgi:hypothetical protein
MRYGILQDMNNLTNTLEVTYLKTLEALLMSTAMTVDTARSSAKAFLQMLPFTNEQDVEQKIEQFVRDFPLFISLKMVLLQEEEQIETSDKIEKMRAMLKSGNIDGALSVAQQQSV